ncbi:hypothetical protein ONR57_03900 [Hoyosella sp. YIM 151337]|uniref:hypothetical protein n=1 Tax=Hoyosella sp. YIM 151337 TaxID=2992742 RepID=UPI0022359AC0|nr:hypothetical protein [Hoyosella sp. YIM 151337]MCW4352442.1 hypothetical protein [Hoyosella sp. YIM 151337]
MRSTSLERAPAHRREELTSYLPVAATTINSYETASQILDVTVTAAPSSVADDDDEATVAAVDSASVSLRPQTLPGVSGSPLCLVFRARVAAHKATIHAITYQVAIQSRIGGEGNGTLQRLNLARTQTPQ